MVVGVIAIGQTLIILTAGIDLSCGMVMALGGIVMTKLAADTRAAAARWRSCAASRVDGAVRAASTACWSRASGCRRSSSRWARSTSRSRSRRSTPTRRRSPTCRRRMTCARQHLPARRHRRRLRHGADARCCTSASGSGCARPAPGRHVYAVGNNPEATRLTGIPTAARAARRLRAGRRVLRHRGAAVGGPHRRRRPERRPDREPRHHHRGGARRHQPVRRPRHRPRHAGRRPDRRRVPQRPAR